MIETAVWCDPVRMQIVNDLKIYNEVRFDKKFDELELLFFHEDDPLDARPFTTRFFFDKGTMIVRPPAGDTRRYRVKLTGSYKTAAGAQQGRISTVTHSVGNLVDATQMIWIGPASSEQDFVVKTYRTTDLMLNDGDLYMVNPAGELLAYHHDRHGDFGDWKGKVIGSAWGDMTWIGAARGGSIYAVSRDGQLRYYHHNGGTFDDWNGRVIGGGWNNVQPLGVGRFGQLYALNANGDLLYYHHDADFNFDISGRVIGGNFDGLPRVFTGGTNCLYAINPGGDLLYYYHDDSLVFVHSGMRIGEGWGAFTSVTSSGNGEIYAVEPGGLLRFYRHDVDKKFMHGSSAEIGNGWGGHGPLGVVAAAR